jgi:hypothetical protein
LSITALNGICVRHAGFCAAPARIRSRVNNTSTYTGCSHHSVPSLSNVAIRSLAGTKSGLPGLVVSWTSLMIAALVAPSFHEGSGSVKGAVAQPARRRTATTSAANGVAAPRCHRTQPRIRRFMRNSRFSSTTPRGL